MTIRVVVFCLAATIGLRTADAQLSGLVLPPANADIDDSFSEIASVRELPDGRVLVVDPREQRVVVADFTRGVTTQLGRVGSGPGEFRRPRQVLGLSPDSSLLFDTQQRRLIVIVGADSMLQFPVEDGLRVTRFDFPIRGVDRDGRVVAYASIPNAGPSRPRFQPIYRSDSMLVVIARLWQPGLDTIARIQGMFRGRRATDRNVGNLVVEYDLVSPFGVEEQAWMFPDGWMALALASPYRVDWRTPDGLWIRGAPLPFARISVTDEEKRAAMNRYAMPIPAPPLDPSDYPGWPEYIPPFPNGALLPLSDGRVAIARMVTHAASSQVYDIVDRTGSLSGRLEVPLNAHIIAFGRESVYMVTRGELGLEHLTRHPLPRL